MATKTIKFLQGGGFVERQTNADTVEQLRGEFPDDISISQQYKQIGNSVTVPVVKRISDEIIKILSGK